MSASQPNSIDVEIILESLTEVIAKMLEIVGHDPEDAKKQSNDLLELISRIAMSYLLINLDKPIRETEMQTMQSGQTLTQFNDFVRQHFTYDQVQTAFIEATEDVMSTYLEKVGPELTEDQANQVTALIVKTGQSLKE